MPPHEVSQAERGAWPGRPWECYWASYTRNGDTDGVPRLRPWCFSSGWQAGHHTGWSPDCLQCLDPLSTASSTESLSHKVIHLPKTQYELQPISRGFAGLARHRAFFKAAGAIDGCHVHVKPPSGPDGQCYRNRKLFPSIILQAVCDHQGRFIDIYVGRPGSVHDSRVLRYSPLYRSSLYLPPGHFILADGGYPCLQHPLPLITPYKRPIQGVGAQRFNSHHSRARSIIERAFGMMKTRFRAIFLQALEVITACAILHNICLGAGDIVAPEDEPEEDEAEDEGENGLETVSGAPWRDQLSAEVSALEEVPPDHQYL
ncbi:putative nuclease HARBI1 [Micropterus dolomieu]|uniref:putative nuclease HARBI1 n=1 Tax=Micropterus dolomieu TaxID=147949 RepID=UPI001E8D66B8|nr:putative nuclease HARBI1 [Micropterus dolomieu]